MGFFFFVASVVLPLGLILIIWRWRHRQSVGGLLLLEWFFLVSAATVIILPKPAATTPFATIAPTGSPATPPISDLRSPNAETSRELPFSTEILTFMDIVPKTEINSLPKNAQTERCWGDWCEVAGWEFKSNPMPAKLGTSLLMDVIDARIVWPDGRETTLEKDVNLGAISPAPPALLTYRVVHYGTYQGSLPVGDYRFRFTLADGPVTERVAAYVGEVMHIPHDVSLDWDGKTLVLAWQQDKPTGPLERYDVLVYPEDQRFPGQIQKFDILKQIAPGLENGKINATLDDLRLEPKTTYIVELSAKAGTAHTGTGQRLKIKTEAQ